MQKPHNSSLMPWKRRILGSLAERWSKWKHEIFAQKKEKIKWFVCTYYIIMFIRRTLSLVHSLELSLVKRSELFNSDEMNQPSARCIFQLNFNWNRFCHANKQRWLAQYVRLSRTSRIFCDSHFVFKKEFPSTGQTQAQFSQAFCSFLFQYI